MQLLGFLTLVLLPIGVNAAHRCHFFYTEEACLSSNETIPCYWCSSSAVPATCYDANEVKKLPPAIFHCERHNKDTLPKSKMQQIPLKSRVFATNKLIDPENHRCHFYNNKDSCIDNKEGNEPCYWCRSIAVPSTCYNETEAKKLPPGVFECDKKAIQHQYNWELTDFPEEEMLMRSLFEKWMKDYEKYYENEFVEIVRYEIFKSNARLVTQHNQQHLSYTLEMNQFADKTWGEFQESYLGVASQNCSATHFPSTVTYEETQVPEKIDWRLKGGVSPVKNQGECGSCWTFSTTGCLESHMRIKHQNDILLSEQNLIDCAQDFDNHGCNGGLPSHAFQYIKYNQGIDSEAEYPYHAKQEVCKFQSEFVAARVVDVVNITAYDENELKNAVGSVGPVSVAYQVSSDFRFYKSGIYDSTQCKSGESDVNHAVLAVGYDVNEKGEKYWIVKNSWGTTWGMNGFFYIAREKNMCGIADCASYPVV